MSGKMQKRVRRLANYLGRTYEEQQEDFINGFMGNVKAFSFWDRIKLCIEILTIKK